MTVFDNEGLRKEIQRLVNILDDGEWITAGLWGAYAFKSLLANDTILSFGSDWTGNSAADYHCHLKYLIQAAINRTT